MIVYTIALLAKDGQGKIARAPKTNNKPGVSIFFLVDVMKTITLCRVWSDEKQNRFCGIVYDAKKQNV